MFVMEITVMIVCIAEPYRSWFLRFLEFWYISCEMFVVAVV